MAAGIPKPTRDLAQAEADLRDTGVCLIEGALSPAKHAGVRDALYRAADDDRTRGRWFLSLNPTERQFASDTMLTLLGYKADGLGMVNGASPL